MASTGEEKTRPNQATAEASSACRAPLEQLQSESSEALSGYQQHQEEAAEEAVEVHRMGTSLKYPSQSELQEEASLACQDQLEVASELEPCSFLAAELEAAQEDESSPQSDMAETMSLDQGLKIH